MSFMNRVLLFAAALYASFWLIIVTCSGIILEKCFNNLQILWCLADWQNIKRVFHYNVLLLVLFYGNAWVATTCQCDLFVISSRRDYRTSAICSVVLPSLVFCEKCWSIYSFLDNTSPKRPWPERGVQNKAAIGKLWNTPLNFKWSKVI